MPIQELDKKKVGMFHTRLADFGYLDLHPYSQVEPAKRAAWTIEQLKKNLSAPQGTIFGHFRNGRLLGIAGARISTFDSEHFEKTMGRIGPIHLSPEAAEYDGKQLVLACMKHLLKYGCKFVDVRVPTADLKLIRSLLRTGFYLADTQVEYAFRFDKTELPKVEHQAELRLAVPDDRKQLLALTRDTFDGYIDRFHLDPFFDDAKATDMYVKWIGNSLTKLADAVLVAEIGMRIAGFLTLEVKHKQNKATDFRMAEGVLAGVAPWARGKGIYTSLLAECLPWFKERADVATVVTQVDNTAVQTAWANLGYRLVSGKHTFHWHTP